jgi:putative ABC transport system ATP-binding protein
MLELIDITKAYNAAGQSQFHALRGIRLALHFNQIIVFQGPSGSGKTTLLSIIGCMTRPTSGRVFLDGKEITSLPERFLAKLRRHRFGFIFQAHNLLSGFTVLENVMIPAYPSGIPHRELTTISRELLARFRVETKINRKIETLSAGEKQRVAIARALVNAPSFIIADEPTAHLDTELAAEFMTIIADLKEAGKTIFIASHDPLVFESSMVDRVVRLRDGKLQQENQS